MGSLVGTVVGSLDGLKVGDSEGSKVGCCVSVGAKVLGFEVGREEKVGEIDGVSDCYVPYSIWR